MSVTIIDSLTINTIFFCPLTLADSLDALLREAHFGVNICTEQYSHALILVLRFFAQLYENAKEGYFKPMTDICKSIEHNVFL